MSKTEITGYVEYRDEVRTCRIILYEQGTFGVWMSEDLHDGFDDINDFIDECGGFIYPSLKAYKNGSPKTDLTDWVKNSGWTDWIDKRKKKIK